MAATSDTHARGHKPGFVKRWLFSTNHRDIGTLYLIFAVVGGSVGGLLSEIMRAQLQFPNNHIVTEGQAWNIIISGLAFLVFLFICFRTCTSKEHVADNYWGSGATILEWTPTSPPAFHTYMEPPRIS